MFIWLITHNHYDWPYLTSGDSSFDPMSNRSVGHDPNPVEDMLARAKQERQAGRTLNQGKPGDELMSRWVEAVVVKGCTWCMRPWQLLLRVSSSPSDGRQKIIRLGSNNGGVGAPSSTAGQVLKAARHPFIVRLLCAFSALDQTDWRIWKNPFNFLHNIFGTLWDRYDAIQLNLWQTIWRFPEMGGTPKWLVYQGKSHL